jgi:hypothetical protein
MPAPALMTIAMPAITAKAANRLPLTPHCGRKNLNGQPSLPIVNRAAMLSPPAKSARMNRWAQYRVTRLTKSGKLNDFRDFCVVKQKGRRKAGLSASFRSDADQYFATTGPPQLKR